VVAVSSQTAPIFSVEDCLLKRMMSRINYMKCFLILEAIWKLLFRNGFYIYLFMSRLKATPRLSTAAVHGCVHSTAT